jgi:hypothetical protein
MNFASIMFLLLILIFWIKLLVKLANFRTIQNVIGLLRVLALRAC